MLMRALNYGCTGRILRVNLNKEEIFFVEPKEVFYRRYFGGRGLIAYFLLKELESGMEPLHAHAMHDIESLSLELEGVEKGGYGGHLHSRA